MWKNCLNVKFAKKHFYLEWRLNKHRREDSKTSTEKVNDEQKSDEPKGDEEEIENWGLQQSGYQQYSPLHAGIFCLASHPL